MSRMSPIIATENWVAPVASVCKAAIARRSSRVLKLLRPDNR